MHSCIGISLPDFKQRLAADALLAGIRARHDAFRGTKDQESVAALDRADVAHAKVSAAAGLGDAFDASDNGCAVFVRKRNDERVIFLLRTADVALFREHFRYREFHLRKRERNRSMPNARSVLEADKQV